MKKRKSILITIGEEAFICKCLISYDENNNIENVELRGLLTNNVAEQEGVDVSGIGTDLVIEARIKQIVIDLLNNQP